MHPHLFRHVSRSSRVACALVLACLVPLVASAQKRAITHEDVFTAKRLGSPVASPDGRWAVFQVTEPA